MKYQVPTAQNVTKNRMDFPVWEQSITNKTEAITRGTIQNKNRELPFYPYPIYRPPPMATRKFTTTKFRK